MKPRYEKECIKLGVLAERQLNLPKNVIKPNFEHYTLQHILDLLDEEIYELKHEIINKYDGKQKEKLDFQFIYNEIGDCAGVLAGLVSKINIIREEHHDDGS